MANGSDTDSNDSGFSSRKLVFSFFSACLVSGMWAFTNKFPGLGAQFPTAVGGILAVLACYLGGNVSHAFVSKKFGIPDMGDDTTVATETTKSSIVVTAPTGSTPEVTKANTSTETKTIAKGQPVVAETGSMTIVKGSPADADGEPTEDASE